MIVTTTKFFSLSLLYMIEHRSSGRSELSSKRLNVCSRMHSRQATTASSTFISSTRTASPAGHLWFRITMFGGLCSCPASLDHNWKTAIIQYNKKVLERSVVELRTDKKIIYVLLPLIEICRIFLPLSIFRP